MRLLLDTNALLYMIGNIRQLPLKTQQIMAANDLLLSIASPWEMTIKHSIGKLHLNTTVQAIIETHSDVVTLLPITMQHLEVLAALPHYHRDPFDRIIIAQAITEKLPIISIDEVFDGYDVERIWE